MQTAGSYGVAAQEIVELFGDYLESADPAVVLVLSERPLSAVAKEALGKSFSALGYGVEPCMFAVLSPEGLGGAAEAGARLDASALFMLVEGIDPLVVVSADLAASSLLVEAYRDQLLLWDPLAKDSVARVFGRPGAVFGDFEAMMLTPEGKHAAWGILRLLG